MGQVYPRACGGTAVCILRRLWQPGLSPRVRGNHRLVVQRSPACGSIPARAGEPGFARRTGLVRRGLSPRVRGNRSHGPRPSLFRRSIPARAGEPGCCWPWCLPSWVYPRACGGTSCFGIGGELCIGLSPRVRGNHVGHAHPGGTGGSIPARAGEPFARTMGGSTPGVYPRACGGTAEAAARGHEVGGLSPRVRGNRHRTPEVPGERRSIPARAGEPSVSSTGTLTMAVYPRACGGTDLPPAALKRRLRSIPARAGEPIPPPTSRPATAVYPRACGGTRFPRDCRRASRGLSPRVRGNQGLPGAATWGSIPARAGEPVAVMSKYWHQRSIPARAGEPVLRGLQGLSPRVRGNPVMLRCNGQR